MKRAHILLALAGLSFAACRTAGSGIAPAAVPAPATVQKGIDSLNVAVYLFPFAKDHLAMLRRVNTTGRLPGTPITPEQVLGMYLDMMRRRFKSVTVFDSIEDIPPQGYDLHYGLNLLIIYGYVSGRKAEVHLTSHFRAPDGELVDHILYDVARVVPDPAKSNMIREAAEEARDLTEKRILESVKLAEYARTR